MSTETAPQQSAQSSGWSISRIAMIAAGLLVGIIVLIFGLGLLFALGSEFETTAIRLAYLRNLVFITLAIEGIVIIFAIAVLIVQIARLVNLLQSEVRPILEDTQAAAKSAKGTAEFVGNNVTQPIIKLSAFAAGVGTLVRELGGIRRAIRRSNHKDENDGKQA
jgi:hypothetical protein